MNKRNSILIIILIAAGFFVYAFNLNNPLFWDDDEWIKGNIFVHDFSHLKEIFTKDILAGFGLSSNYWRPLLLLSFAFNYAVHGAASFGYHLINNGFHIAAGVLIFLLLKKILGVRVAFVSGLLFLIHPLQTEAVTYISGRGDPMSVFFMLLALWFFIKSRDEKPAFYQTIAMISFVAALLSRETAILFPVLLSIFYVSFLSGKKFLVSLKEAAVKTYPYWLVSGFYLFLRLTVLNFKNTLNFYQQANTYTENLIYRLYTFGHVLIEYFKLIFFPTNLHMERDLPISTSLFQWPVWLAVLVILVIIALLFLLYQKQFKDKHNSTTLMPQSKIFSVWFFFWAWFFAALAPVSGIIPINALMYEHWLYLPLAGFFTLAGFYLVKLLEILRKKNLVIFSLLIFVFAFYFGFFAVASIKRNIAWGNPVTFYEDILKYNSQSTRVLNNLGNLYSEKKELDKAAEIYKKAIENQKDNPFAQPYYNLGNIYRDQGKINEAISEYKKAIGVDPRFSFAYQNLAVVYASRGELRDAASMLEKYKELKPADLRVYYNLALIYTADNDLKKAVDNLNFGLNSVSGEEEVKRQMATLLKKISR